MTENPQKIPWSAAKTIVLRHFCADSVKGNRCKSVGKFEEAISSSGNSPILLLHTLNAVLSGWRPGELPKKEGLDRGYRQ